MKKGDVYLTSEKESWTAITIAMPPSEFQPVERSASTCTQSPTETNAAVIVRDNGRGGALRNMFSTSTRSPSPRI